MSKPQRSGWKFFPVALAVLALCAVLVGVLYAVAPARAFLQARAQAVQPPFEPPVPPPPPPLAPTALLDGTQDVAVLMYHDITDQPSVYFDIRVAEFRRQLRELKEAGASVISMADLYDHLHGGKPIPPRAVVLTFDDGYLGNLENAYPLLKEFGYPATFFVHTSAVGVKTGREHMTWEQLKKLDGE
ncbi:MAG TPA: polysaccharide deacetylase family protein, partial [Armatimonadota bacterium]|nr:polysaccharide deacetylase family protein [Armatimonadota bacterium]